MCILIVNIRSGQQWASCQWNGRPPAPWFASFHDQNTCLNEWIFPPSVSYRITWMYCSALDRWQKKIFVKCVFWSWIFEAVVNNRKPRPAPWFESFTDQNTCLKNEYFLHRFAIEPHECTLQRWIDDRKKYLFNCVLWSCNVQSGSAPDQRRYFPHI